MKNNLITKIWNAHIVESGEDLPDILSIDLHLLHEVTSPQAFDILRKKGLQVYAPHRTLATVDHNVATTLDREKFPSKKSKRQIMALRKNCKKFGISLWDMGSGKQGIVHIVGPEQGLTQPGMTIACGDSHTSTHGAFAALAFGIGTTEIGHVLATGALLLPKYRTMQVNFQGDLKSGVGAKDMVLRLIQAIGVHGATGYLLEYCGEPVKQLSMEERMTLCNMSVECGARSGLISPDATTYAYLENRPGAPKGAAWNQALDAWNSLSSDDSSTYDRMLDLSIHSLAPMLTWGTTPSQSIAIDEVIPSPDSMLPADGDLARKALAYMNLDVGQSLEGVPIDYVFLGSCANARISDYREAARLLRGRKIARGVTVLVVPGSEAVRKQLIEEKLDQVFIEAGAQVRQPGCSMCLALNGDTCPPGKRVASTSNRNFIGRQGPGVLSHLMSPLMAAAAAITGTLTDVRKLL